jgi:hypothetical protein
MSSNYATPPPQGHTEGGEGSGSPQGLMQGSVHVATIAGIPIRCENFLVFGFLLLHLRSSLRLFFFFC